MDRVYLLLTFIDGWRLEADFPSIGMCAQWISALSHIVHCNPSECKHGSHMGRYPMRQFDIQISTSPVTEVQQNERNKEATGSGNVANWSRAVVFRIHSVTDGAFHVRASETGFPTILHGSDNECQETADTTQQRSNEGNEGHRVGIGGSHGAISKGASIFD